MHQGIEVCYTGVVEKGWTHDTNIIDWWVYSLAIVFPVGVTLLFTEVMNVPLPMWPF